MKYTFKEFELDFPDDAACLEFIFWNRWPNGGICCPFAECRDCYTRFLVGHVLLILRECCGHGGRIRRDSGPVQRVTEKKRSESPAFTGVRLILKNTPLT